MGRLAHAWQDLRGSLWFVPGVMAIAAMALALVMLRLDDWWAPTWILESGWIYSRSAAGARDLLSTVAASMITIAGLTFSIVVVALQLASSQFGPRVLRNYMRDRGSQFVLGTYIATFLYCLMVMRTIGDVDADQPRLAVTVGVGLAIASLAVLIYFLHHSAKSIHAPNVIAGVARELRGSIDRIYPAKVGEPAPHLPMPITDSALETTIDADADGYLQRVDGDALIAVAEDHDLVVRVLHRPGDFVFAGQPLLAVSPVHAMSADRDASLKRALFLGSQRTAEQDVEFCFEQLVQVGLRALSPAYNDPLTAAACIEHLGAALHRLLQRDEPPSVRAGRSAQPRVIAPPVGVDRLIDLVLTPLIESAGGSSIVLHQLSKTLEVLAPQARTHDVRDALAAATAMIEHAAQSLESPRVREAVINRSRATLSVLHRAG